MGWGVNGDVPFSGDVNGDGKADYNVWRPGAAGIFYSQYTSGGGKEDATPQAS